ncbi:Protein-S-isoprenylcysteine O-methyltransferase [Mycena venus]|uniref:Protein-S-isoprenylcysteine O-methyltransferase n=1 Tax=Mycena venus TaxID=2733690 RepID=A0A8H7CJZ5_9AGAR|nr:Protein-S-isoprenylcysteine O-methyltransferase [Mycena venus]
MAPTAKLLILLATALFYDRSLIPPTLPPSLGEQKRAETHGRHTIGWYESLAIPIAPPWMRMVYWTFTITEVIVILAGSRDTAPLHSAVTGFLGTSGAETRITATFGFGAFLIVTGAMIRFRCFKEMGRHFTFSLSLRDGHALITSGPYAIVRHPGYTSGHMTLWGAALTVMSKGSWWFGGGYATGWGMILGLNFICSWCLMARSFLRGAKEDAYLKSSFGEQWRLFCDTGSV